MLQIRLPDQQLSYTQLSTDERCKHAHYIQAHDVSGRASQIPILSVLTPDDVRMLIETEDEYKRRGNFQRVFPNANSGCFLRYFLTQRYYNLLLHAWLDCVSHSKNIELLQKLCKNGIPFNSTPPIAHIWSSHFKCNLPRLVTTRLALKTFKSNCKNGKKKVSKVGKH